MNRAVLALISLLFLAACSNDGSAPSQARTFLFGMVSDSTGTLDFTATTADPDVIAAVLADLEKPQDRRRHINGAILRGNNGNMDWNWHFDPDDWTLAEMSTEVCDGLPTDPQTNLDYWVETVGRFCPWGSYAKQEVKQ